MAVKLRVEWKLLRSTRRGNIFEKWFSCDPSMRMIIVDRESAFTSIRFVFYVDVSLIEKSRDIFTVSCWNTLICLRFLSIYSWLHNCPTWLFVSSFRFAKVDFYYLVCGCFLFPFFLFFSARTRNYFFRDPHYYTFATKYPRSLEICVSFVDVTFVVLYLTVSGRSFTRVTAFLVRIGTRAV